MLAIPCHGRFTGTGIQADSSFHQHGPEILDGTCKDLMRCSLRKPAFLTCAFWALAPLPWSSNMRFAMPTAAHPPRCTGWLTRSCFPCGRPHSLADGESYASGVLIAISLSAGTVFTPAAEQSELFASLLLDGMRWMVVGAPATWDWSVRGRDMGTVPRRVTFNASRFGAIATTRTDELAGFRAAIEGSSRQDLRGHRAFWTSDYSVMHSVSDAGVPWMASIHMHSNRTVSARCVNGQAAMNEHTGDGEVYTYYDGGQYDSAFGSWDWRRLPGITAAVERPMLPCSFEVV